MKITPTRRKMFARAMIGCVGLLILVFFAGGCCTVKVNPPTGKILLIVKKSNPAPPPNMVPVGALVDAEILRHGDKLLVINRFGSAVKVVFEPGVIVEENPFTLRKCEQREVTITLTDPTMKSINVIFEKVGGPGHGGADMIVEPPGGP